MANGYEVVSDRERAYKFCQEHAQMRVTPDTRGIVQLRRGEVIGAVCYDEWNGSNIFMTAAGLPGRRWLTREFLYWAFHVPFGQLNARRITCWVEGHNVDSQRFVKHLGFRLEATLTSAASDGGDVCLYVMHAQDCRHLDARYIRERSEHVGQGKGP